MRDGLPLLAICGRPNVGKSTLFNRLVGGRPALVHDSPHLTRDRRYGELDYDGTRLRVVDTGGLDPDAAKDVIGAGVHRQAREALSEADVAVLVLDARLGVTALDHEVVRLLRPLNIPLIVAANKVDGPGQDALVLELYSIGISQLFGVSAAHGRGVEDLMDAVVEALGPSVGSTSAVPAAAEDEARPLRVAFVGRPNAGKSSLLNRLVGAERALVHDQPGTTTDPVDAEVEIGGRRYVLVDTAGIRRRPKVSSGSGTPVLSGDQEKLAVSLALGQIRQADVVVLLIDSSLGPAEQDCRLASMILDAGRALVVAMNKSDLVRTSEAAKELRSKLDDDLRFATFAPFASISAARGDGVGGLMESVSRVAKAHGFRVGTSELNTFFADVLETHPPPIYRGKAVKIRYLTQGSVRPPTFVLWVNRREGLSESYKRFIVNQLRARYPFEGTPIRLAIRAKSEGKKRGRKS